MKKTTAFLLIIVILCSSFISPAYATEDDMSLREVLVGKNQEIIDAFMDPALFQESMEGVVWENQPTLILFVRGLYECTEMTLEELVQDSVRIGSYQLVILHDDPIGISKYEFKTKIGAGDFPIYPYIQDILDGKATQDFLGESCRISNVFFVGYNTPGDPRDLLYVTDKGMYVRCYTDGRAEPVEYTWQSYCEVAREYYAYISSDEYRFDENGDPIYRGPNLSFVEFAEEYKAEKEAQRQEELAARQRKILYISIGAVAVLATAVTAVFLLRRKKKRDIVAE